MPRETLARLLDLDLPVHFLRGNGDREALAPTGEVPEPFREILDWTKQQLDSEHVRLIETWPATARLTIDGSGETLFCHATPRSDTEIFTRSTPEERLLPIFGGLDTPLVVCGHTHMQFDRMVGGIRVVNAGSVGMPFGEPGAYWLLLDRDIQFRWTHYDFDRAAERIRATSYPLAEDFAANNLLRPPGEEEALRTFAVAELKELFAPTGPIQEVSLSSG